MGGTQPCRGCGRAFPYDPEADFCPTCVAVNVGRVVIENCPLNDGRYNGRSAAVIDVSEPRLIIKLDRFQPGLDSPDGIVYLRPGEFRAAD